MKVLVVYASKAGSTKGIAEFIGGKLGERGVEAEVREVRSAAALGEYDAFVVGSALYMGHWMKEAKQFVEKNKKSLLGHPVWLFSSGPTSPQKTDDKGRDLREVSGPTEIDALRASTNPRDHRVFFGALFGDKLTGATGFTYRLMKRSKTIAQTMPDGDYRDWKEIEDWVAGIGEALSPRASAPPQG